MRNSLGQGALVSVLHVTDDVKRRKLFDILLKKGAEPWAHDPSTGKDVLIWAVFLRRTYEVRQILIAARGETNFYRRDHKGYSALHYAVFYENLHIVSLISKEMKQFQLSVDIPDFCGITPYIYAQRKLRHDIVDILVNCGASTGQLDPTLFWSLQTTSNPYRIRNNIRCLMRVNRTQPHQQTSGIFLKPNPTATRFLPAIGTTIRNDGDDRSQHSSSSGFSEVSNKLDAVYSKSIPNSLRPYFALQSVELSPAYRQTAIPPRKTFNWLFIISSVVVRIIRKRRMQNQELHHLNDNIQPDQTAGEFFSSSETLVSTEQADPLEVPNILEKQ